MWDWKERNKKGLRWGVRSEDRKGERNKSTDGAEQQRNRDGMSKRRAASERDLHPPSGPDATPVLQRQPRTHTHRRWGHRDETDILFTVVHLPPGSKWSHNLITHSQRPPILQVQSNTHAFIFSFSLPLSCIDMPIHRCTCAVNVSINKSC